LNRARGYAIHCIKATETTNPTIELSEYSLIKLVEFVRGNCD
jgi:hypothetical protein